MTDSKRAFWFVVAILVGLGYGYVRYASGWLSSSPKKESLWTQGTHVATMIRDQVVRAIEESESSSDDPLTDEEDSDSADETEPVSNVFTKDQARMFAAVPIAGFLASVAADTFTPLHAVVSSQWQEQMTADEMRDRYLTILAQEPKFNGIQELTVTSGPVLQEDGSMLVSGHARSGEAGFTYSVWLIKEGARWLASDFEIEIDR